MLQSLLSSNLRVLKEQAAFSQQKWLSDVTQEMVWDRYCHCQLFHCIPKPEQEESNGRCVQSQGNTALLSRQVAENMRLPILEVGQPETKDLMSFLVSEN